MYIIFISAKKMFLREHPYIQTTEKAIPTLTAIKLIDDLNHIHYSILDHNDKYYSLADVSRFINIKAVHQVKTYDENGKQKKKNTELDLKDCDASDFEKSERERVYYNTSIVGEKRLALCLTKEARNMTIEGNIQSAKTYKTKNSFMSI